MKVVLLPGMDGTGLLFKPLVDILAQSIEVQIISFPNEQTHSYSELCQYVLSRLPEEDYILVGESFSGYIAYKIALTEPKYLKSVIFVACFLFSPRPFLLGLIKLLPAKLLFSIPPPAFVIKILMLNASASKETIKLLKETLKNVPAEVLSFRLNEINKLSPSYETCKLKATYIQAREDRLIPEKAVDIFYSLFTDLNVIKINGSHFCIQSNPEACATIIQNEILALSTKTS